MLEILEGDGAGGKQTFALASKAKSGVIMGKSKSAITSAPPPK